MDADDLLADLDESQTEAVTTPANLVAVIAGAGSGKTRVLTRRIAYRIMNETATADHTVVMTFTREAAGELRRRLPVLGVRQRVAAGTFHSICRQLLLGYWSDTGQRPPTLRNDRDRMLREFVPRGDLSAVTAEVNVAASRGWSALDYQNACRNGSHRPLADAGTVFTALDQYETVKRERKIIDLDDLLSMTVRLIDTDQGFAEVVRWRFRHILVDEAQDLNPLQHRLINQLRNGSDDLFLVGDPAQAIYGFNGADSDLLVNVGEHFPGIEVIRLPTNHRSTPQIVDAGRYALAASDQARTVVSGRDDGPLVTIVNAADEMAEARQIALQIAATDPMMVRRGDVAVLARTHAVLQEIRVALEAAGVPMLFNADGVGSVYAPHLRQVYRLGSGEQIRAWVQDHAEVANETGDEPLAAVVEVLLGFLREHPTGIGADVEQWIDATNPLGERSGGVELVTFHAAKGREWHTVHLAGVETGLVPHRSATSKAAKAEEARLLYVAITRATDRLIIHWAERRGGYQRRLTPLLSGFTSEAAPRTAPPAEFRQQSRTQRDDTLDALQRWRARLARGSGVLPTQILTDAQLTQLADNNPITPAELDALLGVGPLTATQLFTSLQSTLHPTQDD